MNMYKIALFASRTVQVFIVLFLLAVIKLVGESKPIKFENLAFDGYVNLIGGFLVIVGIPVAIGLLLRYKLDERLKAKIQ